MMTPMGHVHAPGIGRRRGEALLHDPMVNKGIAFLPSEQDAFRLHGLLPAGTLTIQQQVMVVVTEGGQRHHHSHQLLPASVVHLMPPQNLDVCAFTQELACPGTRLHITVV